MNVVLIGMPGSGKSTVGVLLAKALAYAFVDTDLLLQEQERAKLQELQERLGMDGFQSKECQVVASLGGERQVIATGGSVVYCAHSMAHLKTLGTICMLDLSLTTVAERVGDTKERGVVMRPGMTLEDLYAERQPLYKKYADLIIPSENGTPQQIVDALMKQLAPSS